MFNNRIYGLTKGQASPTSEFGKKTKSTPAGTVDTPIDAAVAGAHRGGDLRGALGGHPHRASPGDARSRRATTTGSAFVEVLQNCNIFNDGAWRTFTDKEVRDDRMLVLKHGEPMVFGKERDKGIRLNGLQPGGRGAGW